MREFHYTALDPRTNQRAEATVKAENEQAIKQMLANHGLVPLDIKAITTTNFFKGLSRHVSTKQKVIFSRQLSTLINAGLPLVQSLQNVRDQADNKALKAAATAIITDVEGGSTLADALAKYPEIFNPLFINMVAAGETSGTLDTALERLADQQEKDAEIVSKVRGALVYPIIVLVAITAVVIFMVTTVLPQVKSLYDELPGAHLPFVTRVLFAVAHLVLHLWWVALILVVVGAVGWRIWIRTPPGRGFADELKLRLPGIGPLFKRVYMARFARVSSTLLQSGVPMLKMLSTTADAIGNVRVAGAVMTAAEQVRGGKSLSDSLEGNPHFMELVPDMIRIGEQSGQLQPMLSKVADYYEREVDNQIRAISSIIEPVLMIVIGGIALFIVAAVLLPIYSLVGQNIVH